MCQVSHKASKTKNAYPYGFGNCRKYDREMDRLDLLVLDVKRSQEEFSHVDRLGVRRLARDLGYDGFQQLFPNDLRLDGFIEGTSSHFHLKPR